MDKINFDEHSVQFKYGDDAVDTVKVENQNIPLTEMSLEEVYAHYHMPSDNLKDKIFTTSYTKPTITRIGKQKEQLNIKIKVWRMKVISPKNLFIKSKTINIIDDLKKTWNLNTAIIEKEWIIKLNKDILEGPKYLLPLVEFISLKSLIFFLNVPE